MKKKEILSSEEKIKNILIDTLINMLCFIAILLEYMTENFTISIVGAGIIIIIIYFLEKRPLMIIQLCLMVLFICLKFKYALNNTSEEFAKILLIQSAFVEGMISVWIFGTFYFLQNTKKKKKTTEYYFLEPHRKFL